MYLQILVRLQLETLLKVKGLKENIKVVKRGGGVAKGARDLYEKETKKSAISKNNNLSYEYTDDKVKELN